MKPRRPADHEHRAGRVFVRVDGTPQQAGRFPPVNICERVAAARERLRRQPERIHLEPAHELGGSGHQQAALGQLEGQGQIGPDRRVQGFAGVGIQARRQIGREHFDPGAVERQDRTGGRFTHHAAQPGPDECVHDQIRGEKMADPGLGKSFRGALELDGVGRQALEIFRGLLSQPPAGQQQDRHLHPLLGQVAGADQAVPAVFPTPGQDHAAPAVRRVKARPSLPARPRPVPSAPTTERVTFPGRMLHRLHFLHRHDFHESPSRSGAKAADCAAGADERAPNPLNHQSDDSGDIRREPRVPLALNAPTSLPIRVGDGRGEPVEGYLMMTNFRQPKIVSVGVGDPRAVQINAGGHLGQVPARPVAAGFRRMRFQGLAALADDVEYFDGDRAGTGHGVIKPNLAAFGGRRVGEYVRGL